MGKLVTARLFSFGGLGGLTPSDGFCISAGAEELELGKITGLAPGSDTADPQESHQWFSKPHPFVKVPGGGLIFVNQKAEHQQEQNDLILPSADFPLPQEENFHGALD